MILAQIMFFSTSGASWKQIYSENCMLTCFGGYMRFIFIELRGASKENVGGILGA